MVKYAKDAGIHRQNLRLSGPTNQEARFWKEGRAFLGSDLAVRNWMENVKWRGIEIVYDPEQKQYYVVGHPDWGWFDTVDDAKKRIDQHLEPPRPGIKM